MYVAEKLNYLSCLNYFMSQLSCRGHGLDSHQKHVHFHNLCNGTSTCVSLFCLKREALCNLLLSLHNEMKKGDSYQFCEAS
jgi:hypothetical protein